MRPLRLLPLLPSVLLAACGQARPIASANPGVCSSCHGSADNAAPPSSLHPSSDPQDVGVGAHQTHVRGGALAGPVACDECHVVPETVGAPGHIDGDRAEVTFGALARANDAAPTWSRDSASCAGVYCHGATLAGGSNTQPTWTRVDGSEASCGTCHGVPPGTGRHGGHVSDGVGCENCHPGYTSSTVNGALHVNGTVDVGQYLRSWDPVTGNCVGCHGSDNWFH